MISNDGELKKELKKHIGENEIYKFIKDTIASSQNILLIMDGEKKEMPEIMNTYTDTWGTMVKHMLIKKCMNGIDTVFSIHPEFKNIEFSEIEDELLLDKESIVLVKNIT